MGTSGFLSNLIPLESLVPWALVRFEEPFSVSFPSASLDHYPSCNPQQMDFPDPGDKGLSVS